MREVLGELLEWWRAGQAVALASVVATFRSAPRPPGASMIIGPAGEAVGSVSGGCVEGAVHQLGQQVIETGVPVLQRYGVSDETALGVGLTCGGILDVWVERVDRQSFPELAELAEAIERGTPVAVATVIAHPDRRWPARRLVIRPEGERGDLSTAVLVSRRGRGDRGLAAPLPACRGGGGPDRRPHRHLPAHPRPEVRCSVAGGGTAAA